MKEKETGKMKNQNNTAQSAGKKSFLQKKNVEISFKRYAIDAMGAMALGLFASLLIGTIIKTLAENVGTTGMMAALTSAILGPVATCIFQLRNNGAAISSGMGTAGLVGPIGIITGWSNMPKGYAPGAFDWVGMILVCFILPVVLSWAIGKFMRKKGWIKEGDLKVDLG